MELYAVNIKSNIYLLTPPISLLDLEMKSHLLLDVSPDWLPGEPCISGPSAGMEKAQVTVRGLL